MLFMGSMVRVERERERERNEGRRKGVKRRDSYQK